MDVVGIDTTLTANADYAVQFLDYANIALEFDA